LHFPPCGTHELARQLRPQKDGGVLHHAGQVEVVSSLARDGREVAHDLRWGVYVVFAAPSDYTAHCFAEYGLVTSSDGQASALYRPYHLIGLELGISVASVALRGEATGAATGFRGDVVATAKRDLAAGEVLDGEGGTTVWGKLMPAADSLSAGALPIGLAQDTALHRPVAAGTPVRWADVAIDAGDEAVRARRDMEKLFAADGRDAAE
jgi:predicted homoserine dehydrogenase-like protein